MIAYPSWSNTDHGSVRARAHVRVQKRRNPMLCVGITDDSATQLKVA